MAPSGSCAKKPADLQVKLEGHAAVGEGACRTIVAAAFACLDAAQAEAGCCGIAAGPVFRLMRNGWPGS